MLTASTPPPPPGPLKPLPGCRLRRGTIRTTPSTLNGETLETIPAGGSGMVEPDRGAAVTAFDLPGGTGFAVGVRVELTFRAWRWWVARALPAGPAL